MRGSPANAFTFECPIPGAKEMCFAAGIKAGDAAPFDGDLFTAEYGIWLHQQADHCPDRINAAVSRTASIATSSCAVELSSILAERDAFERMANETARPWYEHPIVVAAASVVGTLGLVWVTTKVVKSAD